MAPNGESHTIVPDNTACPSICNDNVWLLKVAKIQVLHEAMLQDLLWTRNDVVAHILHERNELIW